MNFPELLKAGTPHCQRCGELVGLTKYTTTKAGKDLFFCRPCNTARCKKWRNKLGTDNMKKLTAIAKRYGKKNPERLKAWRKIHDNHIPKKPCQVCGAEKVHAHHPKPKKPFLIVHLCPLHHKHVHLKKIPCPEAVDFSPKRA